jgi:hypothetical protein
MSRPQFRLRSLFIVTAIVAVGCWVGLPAWEKLRPMIPASLRDCFIWCSFALLISFVGAAAWGIVFRKTLAHRLVFLGLSFLPIFVGFIGTVVGFGTAFSTTGKWGNVEPQFLANLMTLALMATHSGGFGTVFLLVFAIYGLIIHWLRPVKRLPIG